jgi:hypothetical protein
LSIGAKEEKSDGSGRELKLGCFDWTGRLPRPRLRPRTGTGDLGEPEAAFRRLERIYLLERQFPMKHALGFLSISCAVN